MQRAFIFVKPHAVIEWFLDYVLQEIKAAGLIVGARFVMWLTQPDVVLLYPEFQDVIRYPKVHQDAVICEYVRGHCIIFDVYSLEHDVFEACAKLKTKVRKCMHVDRTVPANYIHCTDDATGYVRERLLLEIDNNART